MSIYGSSVPTVQQPEPHPPLPSHLIIVQKCDGRPAHPVPSPNCARSFCSCTPCSFAIPPPQWQSGERMHLTGQWRGQRPCDPRRSGRCVMPDGHHPCRDDALDSVQYEHDRDYKQAHRGYISLPALPLLAERQTPLLLAELGGYHSVQPGP